MYIEVQKEIAEKLYKDREPDVVLKDGSKVYFS